MATKTEQERLAVVETKLDIIVAQVQAINGKLDAQLPTFATTEYVDLQIKAAKSSRVKDLAINSLIVGPISALIGFFFGNVVK